MGISHNLRAMSNMLSRVQRLYVQSVYAEQRSAVNSVRTCRRVDLFHSSKQISPKEISFHRKAAVECSERSSQHTRIGSDTHAMLRITNLG